VSHVHDRLGRRVFAGLVMSSMIVAGAILIATDHPYVGWSLFAATGVWAFVHNAAMALSKDRGGR
jgi:membrane-bound ClpP family serine protease